MKRILRIILLLLVAIGFGIMFTSSFTLGYIYRDFSLAIRYMTYGFILLIIYFAIYFSEEIIEKIKIKKYRD